MLKNYKYVFLLTVIHGGSGENELEGAMPETAVYADERSLPGNIHLVEVRKATTHIGRAIWCRDARAFLAYAPVRGK